MCVWGRGSREREREREGGREGGGGRRRWVVHDEKRKGKTFVEGLKEEEYCSRNEEEKGCRFL